MKPDVGQHGDHRPDLFDRRSVRIALFAVIPLVVFALVSAGIRVSQYGIDHTIVVLCEPRLQAGSRAALRVTLISDSHQFYRPTRLAGRLLRGERSRGLFDSGAGGAGYAVGMVFRVPDIDPGPAKLELDIEFDDRRRRVVGDVEIVERMPTAALEIPKDASGRDPPPEAIRDKTRIQLLTEDRGAPGGLTSVLFARTLDEDGRPLSAPVELEIPSGTSGTERVESRTDRLGLMALPIAPCSTDFPVRAIGARHPGVDAGPADGGADKPGAYLYPPVVFAGISARIDDPLVPPGELICVQASKLSAGGPVYADLFAGSRWIGAEAAWADGAGKARLDLSVEARGPLRLQLTSSALMPGRSVAVRHVYAMKDGETREQALREVLRRLDESDSDDEWAEAVAGMPLETGAGYRRSMAEAFALSRLYEGHRVIPQLINSRAEDDGDLAEFKQSFQRVVMAVILAIGLAVGALIGMIAIQARRRQERITAMIMNDGEIPRQRWTTDLGERSARGRQWIQGVVLMLIVLGAFASIALLVKTITWGR